MIRRLITFQIAALILALSPAATARAEIKVVTTTETLAALAREIGGDRIEAESIARGYQDPHFVEPKPSFILKLYRADLLILVGRDLEVGWLPALITQSRNRQIRPGAEGYLDASFTATILEIPQGQITRAMGDVHPLGNPPLSARPCQWSPCRQGDPAEAHTAEPPTTPHILPSDTQTSTGGSLRPKRDGMRAWFPTPGRGSSRTTARGLISSTVSSSTSSGTSNRAPAFLPRPRTSSH